MKSVIEAMRPHHQNFSDALQSFPQFRETLNSLQSPESWQKMVDIFLRYRLLLKSLVNLNDEDRLLIRQAHSLTGGGRNADSFLEELGEKAQRRLIRVLDDAIYTESPQYPDALAELKQMMQNGQEIFEAGLKPQDGDPKSDNAIWGFTKISPEHVDAFQHFIVCHFIERFMTQTYREKGMEMAEHKDYLLNAMTDTLILEFVRKGRFADIFEMWKKSKSEGGLGWMDESQLQAFRDLVMNA